MGVWAAGAAERLRLRLPLRRVLRGLNSLRVLRRLKAGLALGIFYLGWLFPHESAVRWTLPRGGIQPHD